MFRVVTDLAVFDFDEEKSACGAIAQSRSEPRAGAGNTGFALDFADHLGVTEPPTDQELASAARVRSRSAIHRVRLAHQRSTKRSLRWLVCRNGIARTNFTAYPTMPDAKALVDYGGMEELGLDSLWVWDHILLGVDPNFPIIDSLTLLTAIAARTSKIKLGTGILVLPPCATRSSSPSSSQHGSVNRRPAAHGHGVGLVPARVRRGRRAVRAARQDHGREPGDPEALLDRRHGQRQVRATRSPPA